ncbi:MAG: CgeB family protein [Lentisphaeria bacterium]
MNNILIVGHPLYHYLQSIADGFKLLGCNVNVFNHKNTNVKKLEQKNIFNRFRHYLDLRRINKKLLEKYNQFQPDMVLVINGEALLPETISEMGKKSFTILWLVDGFKNIKLPKKSMDLFKKQFVFEPADKTFLPNADYLPYGADPKIYYPKNDSKNLRDISFVGAGHDDRLELLDKIAVSCKKNGYNFEVFGPYNEKHRAKYPDLFSAIKVNGKLEPDEVAEIYRTSKINLNIHHKQSKDGLNPRVFEILACKAFQLCDYKEYLSHFFNDNTIAVYHDFSELCNQINLFMCDQPLAEKYRDNSYKVIKDNHLFKSRCQKILAVYKNL